MSELQGFTRRIGKTINATGTGFMLHPETGAAGDKLGLDFFNFYGLGRGGVLGYVDADVVAAAFFFFEPNLVRNLWTAARDKMDPMEAAGHYNDACAAWGRERFNDVPDVARFCDEAKRVIDAADPRGLSLFAGWRAMPLADDAPGRAMQLIHILREYRGGANGIGVTAVGLGAQEACSANGPGMYSIMGWPDAPLDTAPFQERIGQAEDITDTIVGPAFGVLDDSERETFEMSVKALAGAAGTG